MLIDELIKRCAFDERAVLDCAVSGGADSLALLALAFRVAESTGGTVVAHHVDHNLQPGDQALAIVESAAGRLGAEVRLYSVDVGDGPNLEMRARQARYEVLPQNVLTGHTYDDQAETAIMALMRGAGPRGLAAMSGENRPLLDLRRAETENLCAELGFEYFTDPTNSDPRFTRNRVRNELIPLMNSVADRDVATSLVRSAGQQREVANLLDRLAATVDPADSREMATLDPPIATAAFQRWWREITNIEYSPDSAALDRVLDVVHHRCVATDVSGGWRLERTDGRLRLVPPISSTPPLGN